jgi:hypothetical protein
MYNGFVRRGPLGDQSKTLFFLVFTYLTGLCFILLKTGNETLHCFYANYFFILGFDAESDGRHV